MLIISNIILILCYRINLWVGIIHTIRIFTRIIRGFTPVPALTHDSQCMDMRICEFYFTNTFPPLMIYTPLGMSSKFSGLLRTKRPWRS